MSEPTDPFPDPSITAAVGGPWPVDPTVYELPTAQGVLLQFQWRERGAVLHLPSGTMALADARFPVSPPAGGGAAPPATDAAALRAQLIERAARYEGTPYGMPPGVGEVDCSSYVLRVYQEAGLPIPNCRTAEQIRQQCDPIPWAAVQEGDLLFFIETYNVTEPPGPDGYAASHIGISLGAGTFQMWNAVEPAVVCSDISTAFWQEHLLEARVQPALALLEAAEPQTEEVDGIDVASYQPTDLSAILAALEPRVRHVVVRMYLGEGWEGPSPDISRQQASSARANGASVGAYFWLYAAYDPRESVRRAVALARECGATGPLWIDVEPYTDGTLPTTAQIAAALDECAKVGMPGGIYTGRWVWDLLGDPGVFGAYPLWTADYSAGEPDLEEVPVYGAWTAASGHQWTDRDPATGHHVDRNVFRRDVV